MSLTAFTLDLPCKSYIKKYFSAVYGHPIILNHQSEFGDTVLTKIATTPLSQVNKRVLNISEKDYTDSLKLQPPMDCYYRIEALDLNEQQVYNINRYLESVFETDLCMTVAMAGVFGVEKKIAIERFAARFEIRLEHEITYEALQKKEYRYRKDSTAKNLFLYQMSSPFAVFKRA